MIAICYRLTTHTVGRMYGWPYAATRWQLIKNALNSPLTTLTLTITLNSNPNHIPNLYPKTNPNRFKMCMINHTAER